MTADQLAARESAKWAKLQRPFIPNIPKGISWDSTDAEIEAAVDCQRMNRELDESLAMLDAIPGPAS